MNKKISRLKFLQSSATLTAGVTTIGALSSLTSCGTSSKNEADTEFDYYKDVNIPVIVNDTVDGRKLTAGLIGCGGRGTGAAMNFMEAGNDLVVTHLADLYPEKVEACKAQMAKKGVTIDDSNCFDGLDGYKKVLESDVDVVILATPPYFRPEHFKAAVEKNKHIYYEKPCGVDSPQLRQMLLLGKQAEAKGLKVICGLVRRTQKNVVETFRQVASGAIGEPVSAHVMRNGGVLWSVARQKGWNDMQYMLRNWTNFKWLSSDMLAEQTIHEVDMMRWFMGDKKPLRAIGYGGRARKTSGDMYDFFSVNYEFEGGKQVNCGARQINGCANGREVLVYGTKGYTNCEGKIYNLDGTLKWEYPFPKDGEENEWSVKNMFVQSHVLLVNAIRNNTPLNDVVTLVESNFTANMGRDAAYSGKIVTWDEIVASNERLGPETIEYRDYSEYSETPELPGTDDK